MPGEQHENYSLDKIQALYTQRDLVRKREACAVFGDVSYANYGFWPRDGMSVEEACTALTDLVAGELGLDESDRLLECGCGYGASAAHIVQAFRPRLYVGIDATEARVRVAKASMKTIGGASTVSLQVGDATRLAFGSGAFSGVMSIECAFHFNTRAAFFREAARVLEPGGVLALTDIVPSLELDFDAHSREEVHGFLSTDAKHISDANVYDLSTYEEHLRDAGFESFRVYSIKDGVIPGFANHLERVAHASPPEDRDRRLKAVTDLREKLMVGGDYIVVRAVKPKQ
jgi:cyclopropane fatty-acyl-phospholipid synthase-like methyltransferase